MPRRPLPPVMPPGLGLNDSRTLELFGYLASMVHPKSANKVVANCPFCGFEYTRRRNVVKDKCPRCVHRKMPWPDLSAVLDDGATQRQFGYAASSVHPASMDKVAYRCSGPCHELQIRYRRRLNDSTICKACTASLTATETVKAARMSTLIMNHGSANKIFGAAEESLRSVVRAWHPDTLFTAYPLGNGKSIDVFVPSRSIGVEYCGLAWHHEMSPTPRLRGYHLNKMRACEALGIRLITVFEDEWLRRRCVVEGILQAVLGAPREVIGARSCCVEELTFGEAAGFLDAHHLLGSSKRSIFALGLRYHDKLVACATLAHHHRNNSTAVLVMNRLCFPAGICITGGTRRLVSGLMRAVRQRDVGRLVTWSDNRWSDGGAYKRCGFVEAALYGPDYSYVLVAKPRERLPKQMWQKKKVGCPADLPEHEYAAQQGYARIWDCGKRRWELVV